MQILFSFSGYYFLISTFLWRKEGTAIKDLLINEQIHDAEVRLVGVNGEPLGIMSLVEANKLAQEADMDLVKISPNAIPPVCKIMDYGKFKFDQAKKAKEAKFKAKQSQVELKTIRIGLNISEHDMDYRAKNAIEFINDGNKVKANMMLKGRQNAYAKNGIETLRHFAELVGDVAVMEKEPYQEGKYINMILAPNKK